MISAHFNTVHHCFLQVGLKAKTQVPVAVEDTHSNPQLLPLCQDYATNAMVV